MRLDLSAELFAFPDRNGLDLNAREDRLQILEASMNVLGDNHVVGGLVYRHWMCGQGGCNGELLSTGESITRLV
jgi:hypothetical protein